VKITRPKGPARYYIHNFNRKLGAIFKNQSHSQLKAIAVPFPTNAWRQLFPTLLIWDYRRRIPDNGNYIVTLICVFFMSFCDTFGLPLPWQWAFHLNYEASQT
jgi:hypothetical protein